MLVLFDIDGTLLESPSRIHARAVERATAEVYGVPIHVHEDTPVNDGLTTPLLLRRHLEVLDAWDPDRLDVWRGSMIQHYLALQKVMPEQRPLAGAREALDQLVGAGLRIALLTGNYKRVAVAKLQVAGVWHEQFDLEQGAFGDDSEDRNDLGRVARARAERADLLPLLIVGDTPHDVACARAAGADAVVINSGGYPSADFAGADCIATTLAEVVKFLLDRHAGRDSAVVA